MSVAPDYAEPVIGWRVWHAVDDRVGVRLSSVYFPTPWPQHVPLVAVCRQSRIPLWPFTRGHQDAPEAGCHCGIHAATMETVQRHLPDRFSLGSGCISVVGRVSLWGVVHEYERGWRASHAYPERLYVSVVDLAAERAARVVDELRRYGVPVHEIASATADAMIEEVSVLAA